jgi:hypothetical protein
MTIVSSSASACSSSSTSWATGARWRQHAVSKFYVGFPPAVWKTSRNGIEYGVGTIPLAAS